MKQRESNRPYTRGIHKGERVDGRDYFWPPEFNQWTALQTQAAGVRYAPPGVGMELQYERYPTDRKVGPKRVPTGGLSNGTAQWGPRQQPDRANVMRHLAPSWSSGQRGNPGMVVPYVPVGH